MVNQFRVREMAALFLMGLFPLITYVSIMTFMDNFWYALGGSILCILIFFVIGTLLLSNPFTKMLKGHGILVLNIDSTGVIKLFLVKVLQPFIFGKLFGKETKDVFNRETVYNLSSPTIVSKKIHTETGIKIELTETEYNKGRFALFHFPTLIYNAQLHTIITKDMLSETEKNAFTEHTILYLTRQVEDLSSQVRDFARHAVETLRPKDSIFANKWFWVVAVVLFGILGAVMLPKIWATIQGSSGSVGSALSTATISPR